MVLVAVPINFGLLSYTKTNKQSWLLIRRSPHQFWTTLLLSPTAMDKAIYLSQSPSILDYSPTNSLYNNGENDLRRSPHQFWTTLLPEPGAPTRFEWKSQSPSILDYSPTVGVFILPTLLLVAVPINFGLLSYLRADYIVSLIPVAVPINFGLLSYNEANLREANLSVAVPINFGLLSYQAGSGQKPPA